MTMAAAILGRRQIDRWADTAFDPPLAADLPVVTYTVGTTTALSGTPKLVKPSIVGTGSAVTGWNGQNDPNFRFGQGVYNTSNGAAQDLALYGTTKPLGFAQAARWPVFMTFETGADAVEILYYSLTTTNTAMFRVDGRWVTETVPSRAGFTGNSYMSTLTFPSKKVRRITVAGTGDVGIVGVRVASTEGVWKPTDSVSRRVAIIGDSFVNGAGTAPTGASVLETFAPRLAHLMGADDTVLAGIGSTGWVAGLDTGNVPNNYVTRVSTVVAMNPHALIFYGSINDSSAGTGVQAAVEATLAQCTSVPEVYTIGPLKSGFAAACAAVAAGTAAAGRQYVDLANFISGTGRAGATTGDGNADYWVMADNSHPTHEAHKAIARRAFLGITRVN